MEIRTVLYYSCVRDVIAKHASRFCLLILCFGLMGIWGCPGKTTAPTVPETETPVPSPSPTGTETPGGEETPTPETATANESCDNYAENPEDVLRVLETDGDPYSVIMECTGDIDWYKEEYNVRAVLFREFDLLGWTVLKDQSTTRGIHVKSPFHEKDKMKIWSVDVIDEVEEDE